MTNEKRPSFVETIVAKIIPTSTDFYALLIEHCAKAVECTESLVKYMQTGDDSDADRVRALEHEGDRLKKRNLEALSRAFSTPFDREDIFRAITAIDTVLNYAKSTVREMRVLGMPPDEHTLAMAQLLDDGTRALLAGFSALEKEPEKAAIEAVHALKTERTTEKVYRAALAELFDPAHYQATLTEAHRGDADTLKVLLEPLTVPEREAVATSVAFVVEILKRREVGTCPMQRIGLCWQVKPCAILW